MMLELHATPQEVMRAVEALREFGAERGLSERSIFGLAVALEETASNIVDHALQRDSKQTFTVSLEHSGSAMSIELRDQGPAFDPTQATPKEETGSDPLGGWGIQLVRRFADEIQYRREAGANVLRLTKRLED
jgi:anti-sigma regulatory factor (Ser/Thr protein kinase)